MPLHRGLILDSSGWRGHPENANREIGVPRGCMRVVEANEKPPKLGGFSISEVCRSGYGLVGSTAAALGFASCGADVLAATGLEPSAP